MLALTLRALFALSLAWWLISRLRGASRRPAGADDLLGQLAAWWARAAGPVGPATPKEAADVDPWSVLEVGRGATEVEIRAAYQRQMQHYHPDQVAHLGDELREVAERRTKAINAAYSQLKKPPQ